MFRNLNKDDDVYVIDKKDGPVLRMGKFVNKTTPIPITPTQTAGLMLNMTQQYEFTMRVNVEGQEGDFPNILTTESVHNYGNTIVCSTREAFLSEVDKLRTKSQGEIDRQELNEKTIAWCEEVSRKVNPAYAKEKERDEAIANLNDRLDTMEESIGNALDKILKQLNKK